VISSFTAPVTAGAGVTTVVNDTTRNQGGGSSNESTTTFHLSVNAFLDATDISLGGRPAPALEPGATDAVATPVLIPAETATGTYYLLAKADGNSAVTEGVETNNASSASLVRVGPDLVVLALTAPGTATAGTTISVTDTASNQGGGSASASTTRYYLSTNLGFDASDIPLGLRGVSALAGGTAEPGTAVLTIPAGTAATTYYLLAVGDAGAAVVETIETNNTRSVVIRIVAP
jgi:subtilase family serine protease